MPADRDPAAPYRVLLEREGSGPTAWGYFPTKGAAEAAIASFEGAGRFVRDYPADPVAPPAAPPAAPPVTGDPLQPPPA